MLRYQRFFSVLLVIYTLAILYLSLKSLDGKAYGQFDKVAHFIMYFLLAINISACFKTRAKRISALIVGVCLGLSIECIQEFIPGRGFEYFDIVANTGGIIGGALFFPFIQNGMYGFLDLIRKKL